MAMPPDPKTGAEWTARLAKLGRDSLRVTAECAALRHVFVRDFEKLREQLPHDQLLELVVSAKVGLSFLTPVMREFVRQLDGAAGVLKHERSSGPQDSPDVWLRRQLGGLGAES